MIKNYVYVLILLVFTTTIYSQTLTAGDIAFIEYNADGDDNFSFIAFTDIPAGEIIYFTDNGWKNTGDFRTGEGIITWTSTGINCGNIISLTATGNFSLSADGDQILAYQGSNINPTFITAIQMNSDWDGDSISTNTSSIPTGLTNGIDCLSINPEIDNAKYNGLLSGTIANIRSAINTEANWFGSNTVNQTFSDTITLTDCGVTCSHTITNFTPETGPANTQITINGSGFTSNTLVNFGAETATLISQTSSQIIVNLPNGATTGNITLSENGCNLNSSSVFNVINSNKITCEGGISTTDLFISEITDSTAGSITYIELFNATGSPVTLDGYSIEVLQNGAASIAVAGSYAIILDTNYILPDNETYVVAIGALNSPDYNVDTCSIEINGMPVGNGELANQSSGNSGINIDANKHDFIRLVNANASPTRIDEFGVYGDNNWMTNTGITGDRGFNFRRLLTALPNPDFDINNYLNEWEENDWTGTGIVSCNGNDYSDIGIFINEQNPPVITSITKSNLSCGGSTDITVVALEGFNDVGDTKELVYQWYELAPNNTTWTTLTNNGVYSNTTTDILTISDTSSLNGYQYYCEVREDDADCFIASEAIILSVGLVTWDNTTWKWSDGVTPDGTLPNSGNTVILNGSYNTINGSFSACSLIVNAGILTVNNGDYVEVINDVIVNDGRITTETQGSFVQRGDSTFAGAFTLAANGNSDVIKTTSALTNWYDYTYWSSPVTNATTDVSLFQSASNRRFWFNADNYVDIDGDGFDDDANAWTNSIGSYLMTPGQGFAATHNSNFFNSGTAYDYTFEGPYNTGDIYYGVSYNSANENSLHWNLIGNPYPSAIDIDLFFTENTALIYEVIYMWSHVRPPLGTNPGNEVLNFNQNDYVTVNTVGEAGNGATATVPERKVPSGQSFFTPSRATGDIRYTNSMRVSGDNANDQFFRTTNQNTETSNSDIEKLWINLNSDAGIYSQICVAYADIATDDYDGKAIDTFRNYAGNAGVLYSLDEQGEGFYVIQGKAKNGLNIEEVIKLGFGAYISTNETYTLEAIKTQGDFLTTNSIYLRDNYLGIVHDLSSSFYTFQSDGGTFDDRFEIVFTNNLLSTEDILTNDNDLSIIELNDGNVQFTLKNSILNISKVDIYNIQGQLIYSLDGESSTEIYNLSNLKSSIYIAKITLSNNQLITKKSIKK